MTRCSSIGPNGTQCDDEAGHIGLHHSGLVLNGLNDPWPVTMTGLEPAQPIPKYITCTGCGVRSSREMAAIHNLAPWKIPVDLQAIMTHARWTTPTPDSDVGVLCPNCNGRIGASLGAFVQGQLEPVVYEELEVTVRLTLRHRKGQADHTAALRDVGEEIEAFEDALDGAGAFTLTDLAWSFGAPRTVRWPGA